MEEKKNPHSPWWKIWILAIGLNQVLMVAQIRQSNQDLWNAVNAQCEAMTEYFQSEIQYKESVIRLQAEYHRQLEKLLGADQDQCSAADR